ncbi:MAG: acyl transferase [Flavobacteriaceae bacterium]|nr:acyl transferase [Flavobacteriaceae bacterium]
MNSLEFFIHCQKHPEQFEHNALTLFRFQYENISIYHQYCNSVNVSINQVKVLSDIPFLPISFFRTHRIYGSHKPHQIVFESSGTTSEITSKHYIKNLTIYQRSCLKGFERSIGSISDYVLLALLPTYLERENASLVYMVDYLMKINQHPQSGFFLNDFSSLFVQLTELTKQKKKSLLFGLSSALLDFAQICRCKLDYTTVIETGGMKGKSKELTKAQLHHELKSLLGVSKVYSEYGMTELLSQAYSKGDNIFRPPPWMKIQIFDPTDPFTPLEINKTGAINIIDLANIDSCAFIATQDLGRLKNHTDFELIGRFDQGDLRGCNLLLG